ncbi:MAG: polymerase subunit delta [Pseudomonadota bacterium]|nr:polymerase subunit delta [Pseudomonadota bacterium]
MKLRPDQIKAHLQKNFLPVYFVSGDESLQVMEVTDALRAKARAQGFNEREVLEADAHFEWQQLLDAGNSLSLFADKRILELRLPSGKPGKQGSDVLQAYAARPADDAVLIVSAGKIESAARNSKWFKSLDEAGAVIQCWPVNVAELPRWIEQRMRDRGMQPANGAAALLAERVEGNLLAAAQEVDKLLLLYGATGISVQQVVDAVADSARYSVYDLVDAVLAADVSRAVRMVAGLQAEGEALTLAAWALSREVRSLLQMSESGLSAEAAVIKAGVWENRRALVGQALQRHNTTRWKQFLKRCARLDKMSKGMEPGFKSDRAWDELLILVTQIAKK